MRWTHLTLRFKLTGIFWHISFETSLLCFESTPSLLDTFFREFHWDLWALRYERMNKISDPKWTMIYETLKIVVSFELFWFFTISDWGDGFKVIALLKGSNGRHWTFFSCFNINASCIKCVRLNVTYSVILLVRLIPSFLSIKSLFNIQSNISQIV